MPEKKVFIVFGEPGDFLDYPVGHWDELQRFIYARVLPESTEVGRLERMQEEIQDLRSLVRRLIYELAADGTLSASTLGEILYLDQPFTLEPHNAPLEPEPLP